jgi:ankyrin repeat protein
MKPLVLCFALLLVVLAFQPRRSVQATSSQPIATERSSSAANEDDLRAASARAIKLIQHSQVIWYQRETCTSCHHQLLSQIPLVLARERGVPFDEKVARDTATNAFAFLKDLDANVQGYDFIDMDFDGWALTAAHLAGVPRSISTDAEAQFIASRQLADGSWPTTDQRPPQSSSFFTTTAVCANALEQYLPEQLKGEKEARLSLARAWLLKSAPRTTEDQAYQLFGLRWTRAEQRVLGRIARQLLAEQHEDGGWSQLPSLGSDAYSTGEVLVALHEGGNVPTSDPAYQRGVQYLLKSQQADGSWQVKSRLHPPAPVSPPYVNTDFPPFQHDQFISIMATSWATAALLHALPPTTRKPDRSFAADIAPSEQSEWVRVTLNGSASDLKRFLDSGMKANAKTAQGTSALMLAARDINKVKLLVERGADVNARAASGLTPLMVASRYRGNVDVVGFLLQKGARPNSENGVEVRNEASALFLAVMVADVDTARTLVDAGATIDHRMKILGTFMATPMNAATFLETPAMAEYLISKGGDPNEVDGDKISLLAWATISNRLNTVQMLLAHGARLDAVDRFGMTPLLYAASINHGDTSVIEKLISAGADTAAKTKEGLTALELAKRYNHENMAKVLAVKTAAR